MPRARRLRRARLGAVPCVCTSPGGGGREGGRAREGEREIRGGGQGEFMCHMRRRIHVCHMRRRIHVCHMRRRIHVCHMRRRYMCVI